MKFLLFVPVWMLPCTVFVLIGSATVPHQGPNDVIDDIIDLDAGTLTSEAPTGGMDADPSIQYYFRGHWGTEYIPLRRTPHIDLNAPLCSMENDTIVCHPGTQKTVFYEDDTGDVAVSITQENNHLKMNGMVRAMDGVYEYEPRMSEGQHNTHVRRKRWTANVIHRRVASKPHVDASFGSGNKFGIPKWNASPGSDYCVDVLCVVDYSIYKKFLARHKTSRQAEDKVRFYYAHVINGINMRYASLQKSGLNIKIRLAGYFIAKKSKDLPFMKAYLLASNPAYRVNGRQTLEDLDKFLKTVEKKNRNALPKFNHAMLFLEYTKASLGGSVLEDTGLSEDVYHALQHSGPKDGVSGDMGGTSFVMGICSASHSTSMVVDHGALTSSGIGCHELGHNLGVKDHDGEGGATQCSASKNNMMAPASYLIDESNLQYSFSFSSCSIDQIRTMLKSLGGSSCLQCGSLSPGIEKQTSNLLRELPGVKQSVHDQCKELYGDGSFMCPPKKPTEMCYRMYCYDPQRSACAIISEQMAAPGTPCGYKKWCVMGQCVGNKAAPAVPDECPYPDIPDGGAHCEDACPYMCSTSAKFRQKCCMSCSRSEKYSPDKCCKDMHVPINGMTCSTLLKEGYARQLCEQDTTVKNLCCLGCKKLRATTPDTRSSLFHLPAPRSRGGNSRQRNGGLWNALSPHAGRGRAPTGTRQVKKVALVKNKTTAAKCIDDPRVTINSMTCQQVVDKYASKACENPNVRTSCCASCKKNTKKILKLLG